MKSQLVKNNRDQILEDTSLANVLHANIEAEGIVVQYCSRPQGGQRGSPVTSYVLMSSLLLCRHQLRAVSSSKGWFFEFLALCPSPSSTADFSHDVLTTTEPKLLGYHSHTEEDAL